MSSTLKQVEELFDTLHPEERIQLLQYIAPRITVPKRSATLEGDKTMAAWERLKQIGVELDSKRANGGPSLMDILTEMRNS